MVSGCWTFTGGKTKGKTSKRIRKNFSTKGEALAYQNHIMENIHIKPWQNITAIKLDSDPMV
jgi:hypothetical protein